MYKYRKNKSTSNLQRPHSNSSGNHMKISLVEEFIIGSINERKAQLHAEILSGGKMKFIVERNIQIRYALIQNIFTIYAYHLFFSYLRFNTYYINMKTKKIALLWLAEQAEKKTLFKVIKEDFTEEMIFESYVKV